MNSTKFRSVRALYVAEEWSHGMVLRYFPIAEGTPCDGVKVAEGTRLVTLANTPGALHDAYTVATYHAAMLGEPMPEMV